MPAEQEADTDLAHQELLAQMRQSLGLLRVAFDSTDEAMLIVDHHQMIRWANQKAADQFSGGITALLPGQPISQRIVFAHPGEASEPTARQHPLHSLLEGTRGERRLMVSSTAPNESGANGQLSMVTWKQITNTNDPFVLVIIRNLAPMEQALHNQRAFLQSLAHELRTPLALVSGSLMRLRKLIPTQPSALSHLERAEGETKRLGHLVDQLMLLSDLDTDQFPWTLDVADPMEVVEEWKRQLSPIQQQAVHLQVAVRGVRARLDRNALNHVLDQLLQNSLQFSDGTAQIRIELQLQAQEVGLLFSDSGPGLGDEPSDQTIDIFQRFQRLQQHRSPKRGEGCGLGLAIVKELMQGMGGDALIAPPSESHQDTGLHLELKLPRFVGDHP